jgi:arginyl-tRNA synthetase
MITDELSDLVTRAVEKAVADTELPGDEPWTVTFERPRRPEHGDFATNVALQISSGRGNPREAATTIVDRLPPSDLIAQVDIAGPGFINFKLSPRWLHDVVRRSVSDKRFGRFETGAGVSVNVEFVSANPTGPINIVSGRHAAVGLAVSALLKAIGHEVTREFYMNDAGRQMDLFGQSVAARYLELAGVEAFIPEDGYQGDYVIDIAKQILAEDGDRFIDMQEEARSSTLAQRGMAINIESIRESLTRFGTTFDVWFSEKSLHSSGAVEASIRALIDAGVTEERDGAVFFLSTRYGDDKDRVVRRSDGRPTYLAADIAYMRNKFSRGFDRLIYQLGSDHHGTLPRFLAVADALGFGRDRVEFPLIQVVRIKEGAQTLKGSKRAGVVFLLDELVDQVGVDAVRYTFLTRSKDAPLDFDIELAKQQAPENPVYYVQYAHARICSILRKASESGVPEPNAGSAPLDLLTHKSEEALMRKLASYEDVILESATLRAPQKLTRFIEELAAAFSAFYRDCKVVSEDVDLTSARLTLCLATKRVVADGLGLLGVTAPERM